MRVKLVIPARMSSIRLPGKPLMPLNGKPMVQWVYEACLKVGDAADVVVATPDHEIEEAVHAFGGKSIKTRDDHQTGTDRLAEVADKFDADVYVNVQGDEPLIEPTAIQLSIDTLKEHAEAAASSLYAVCGLSEIDDPAVVKVVLDRRGYALYFSRAAIPYERVERVKPVYKHVGLYAFRRESLLAFASTSRTPCEISESLEQLRLLESGLKIAMAEVETPVGGVDTPEQADAISELLSARSRPQA